MQPAEPPADEPARLAELRSLLLLDTDPEERFDRITRLAQRLFGVPIALVSLLDQDRQWFKSNQGLEVTETPRSVSFCAHALHDDEVLHVRDARLDVRFADNPLVEGDPKIRFYAGHLIKGPSGSKLGTLCIIDREPRDLSELDAASLRDLAEMVEQEIASLHLAASDPLTGLANRRGFEILASKVLDVCARRLVPATLLYLDLDNFKPINDRFGHDEGDRALQAFARILERTFRASDVIARTGGDEFAVLLSGTASSEDAADRLRTHLDARNRESGSTYALGACVGRADFDPANPRALAELIEDADRAMYRQKGATRGR